MKTLVTLAILTLAAIPASASTSVTLTGSSLTFKQALADCPGALGSVTFALGHSRIAGASGVSTQTDSTSAGVENVTFSGPNDSSAAVVVNGHDRTVAGKNVQAKSKNQVACVSPD